MAESRVGQRDAHLVDGKVGRLAAEKAASMVLQKAESLADSMVASRAVWKVEK